VWRPGRRDDAGVQAQDRGEDPVVITQAPTAAELRSHSSWLLAHARQLREEAEQARVRAVQRRSSPKGLLLRYGSTAVCQRTR
jgi:hypothetical protein